jgi:hypothetical protein
MGYDRADFVVTVVTRLSGLRQQSMDKLRLPYCITSLTFTDLPLPHAAQRCVRHRHRSRTEMQLHLVATDLGSVVI